MVQKSSHISEKKTDDWESLMLEVNRELKNLYY